MADEVGVSLVLKNGVRFKEDIKRAADSIKSLGDKTKMSKKDADDASKAWGNFKKKLDVFPSSFSIVSKGLGAMKTGLIGLGGATVGAVGATVGFGIKTAASMEQAQVSFTTMLGSAEKADSFIGEMKAFAKKTPFDFGSLQTASSSLISAGIDAKKVIPIMSTLGDVTSGMGTGSEGIKRATVAIQQMNAAGKISGEDLNQLRDAGIPVYDLLSSALGKTKAEVVDMAQKGKLGQDALTKMMEALETGKGLEKFNGLMEAQSGTLTGLWSTIQDTFAMGAADLMKPLVPALKTGLDKAGKLMEKGGEKITAFFDKPGNYSFEQLLNLDTIEEDMSPFQQTIVKMNDWLKPLINVLKQLPNLFGAIFNGDTQGIAEVIDNMLGNTGDYVGPIRTILDTLKTVFTTTITVLMSVFNWVKTNWPILQPILTAIVGGFLAFQTVATVINTVNIALMVTRGAMVALNIAMAANPVGIIIGLLVALGVLLYTLYQKSETFRNAINALWGGIKRGIEILGEFWTKAQGMDLSKMWDGMKNGFKNAINSIIDWWNNFELKIPKIEVAGKEIFGGATIGTPDIPKLAEGGYVSGTGTFIAGEAGAEAVTLTRTGVIVRPLNTGDSASIGSNIVFNAGSIQITSDNPTVIVDKIIGEIRRRSARI